MTSGRQIRFWLIGLGGFAAIVWLFRDMLLPFVVAMTIAYFLDPVVRWCARQGLPRWLSAGLVLLFFAAIVIALLIVIVPVVGAQIRQFIDTLPGYARLIGERVVPVVNRMLKTLSASDLDQLRSAASNSVGDVVAWFAGVVKNILSGGLALFDVLSVLFVTPVVAFYLLRDWDRLLALVDSWLPRDHAPTIREQARRVDRTLSAYIRGQATVCLILTVFYAVALSLIGLNFSLMIGLISGIVTFIPYVGSLVGLVSGVGVAFGQYEDLWTVGAVAGVFAVGQIIEGYLLTPKLVGDNVGLHPVWVMFALLAGGSVFGFVGVLVALPIAAVIGVLVRFVLARYLDSSFYRGDDTAPSEPAPGSGLR